MNNKIQFKMHLINVDIVDNRLDLINGWYLEKIPAEELKEKFPITDGYSVPAGIKDRIIENHTVILNGTIDKPKLFNPTFLNEYIFKAISMKNFFRATSLLEEIKQSSNK